MSSGTIAAGKKTSPSSGGSRQPIGVDIGTANIVVYMNGQASAKAQMEANAIFTVPALPNTRKILETKAVRFFEKVIQAREPLLATAKGAYMMAAAEDEK